jgi:beta-glucosidase
VNPAGLDFYDRLVDGLLERNIRPFVTLYHWDLPQALQDQGGWVERGIAERFADYAQIVAARLGDRVSDWITLNEPWVTAFVGHYQGRHAPGYRDAGMALKATHNLLLSHGLAVRALRAALPDGSKVGITLDLTPMHAASPSDADQAAVRRADGIRNRIFLDPLFTGSYPQDIVEFFGPLFPQQQPGDMQVIQAPVDFLGINYYTRGVIVPDDDGPDFGTRRLQPEGSEYSQMWEIYPPGIYELLTRVWNDYRPQNIYITENGIPVPDGIDHDGHVRDYRRIRYVRDHLAQCHRAIAGGVPLRGYFHWSLLDNFEWAYGYAMRFGMVYVDFKTCERTVKDSARWYAGVIRNNGLDPDGGVPC